LAAQDHMFKNGQPADYMFIIVTGTIQRYEEIGGQWLVVATYGPGEVTGMLPYSRMTHFPGPAVASEPSIVLRIDKKNFDDMLATSHELGQRLVGEMSNRVRGGVRLEQQREKMASLGRLSAGLAHELNNPASAIHRTAVSLADRFADYASLSMTMAKCNLNKTAIDAIEKYWRETLERDLPDLSPLERSENEEELTDWMEGRKVENPWDLSRVFAETGLRLNDLERFANVIPKDILSTALSWVAGFIEINQMLSEITYSAGSISELVSSVKTYSHMDQSTEHKPTNVCEGLDNTLKMFKHKFNQKNIQLTREYQEGIPSISGNAGELNQVWTYLIENAIDAMDEGGELSIVVRRNDWDIEVKVIDDGEGIPEEIRDRIFDPFFTTKGVGEGTGLGLDIARRIENTHRGQIDVRSKPKRTEMFVMLPIQSEEILTQR